jgi:hypothetical protein
MVFFDRIKLAIFKRAFVLFFFSLLLLLLLVVIVLGIFAPDAATDRFEYFISSWIKHNKVQEKPKPEFSAN